MKKAYIMPLAEVVKTETETMICQSTDISIKITDTDTPFNDEKFELLDNANLGNVFDGLW